MEESMLQTKLENNKVQCGICVHRCVISEGARGICHVRENVDGVLVALNYRKIVSTNIDPIEKKPLYHYMPESKTYSIATVGCNLHCAWCQNAAISQITSASPIEGEIMTPAMHVELAKRYGCRSISYTYSEPTIFLETALETMQAASTVGLKNVWVSNGLMSDAALDLIVPYLDAANIDLKGDERVYAKQLGGDYHQVIKNLKNMVKQGVHLEITTLVVPGVNDTLEMMETLVDDVTSAIGFDLIWHVTRFFPSYKMSHVSPTSLTLLSSMVKMMKRKGVKHVYTGNV